MHCRDAESVEFNSSGVPWLASAESLQHAKQSSGCACCCSALLGGEAEILICQKSSPELPSPCFSPGVILLLQWICQVGILIASVKNMVFVFIFTCHHFANHFYM